MSDFGLDDELPPRFMTKHFGLNTQGRDFFVGDLHGCYNEFFAELTKVDFDFEKDRVFSVGDLIDRGPDSVKCVDLLNNSWFHAVLGNHEDFLQGGHSISVWYSNGGEWIADVSQEEKQRLLSLVNRKCYSVLTVVTEYGKVGVVHAESEDDWQQNASASRALNLWSRTKIKTNDKFLIKNIDLVIVGHTPLYQTKVLGNVLYIDTGAVFKDDKGFLTMVSAKQAFDLLRAADQV